MEGRGKVRGTKYEERIQGMFLAFSVRRSFPAVVHAMAGKSEGGLFMVSGDFSLRHLCSLGLLFF